MSIKENVQNIKNNLDNEIIVAATKYVDIFEMEELIKCNILNFGENKVESFLKKYEHFKDSVSWHFIGHLQRNKARKVVNKIDYLHSLDSIELAEILNKYLEKPLKCFIQVNISFEEQKSGINPNNLEEFIEKLKKYDKIEIVGLMGMAKDTDNELEIEESFKLLNSLKKPGMVLSMGMSNDYLIAKKIGTNFVRLGSILFK